jgi:hypothetical protein
MQPPCIDRESSHPAQRSCRFTAIERHAVPCSHDMCGAHLVGRDAL